MSVVARGGEVDGVRLLSPDTIDLRSLLVALLTK
jgi:hypothetical protein